jgi:hypothetical protein
MRGSFPIVPSTARARRMALSACRAAVVPRHGTARKKPLRVVPGPPSRHDSTARPGTKRSSGLLVLGRIGPGQIVLGPCSGRAARLEYYSVDTVAFLIFLSIV